MTKRTKNVLYVILMLVVIGLIVYSLFLAPEKDYGAALKGGLILAGCILSLMGKKKKRYVPNYKLYEEQYKEIIEGAFYEDKASYRDLMMAIAGYNFDDFDNAHRRLKRLEKNCKRTKDFTAVYTFDGLCYMEVKDYAAAIESYEKLLRYDMANSLARTNLAVCYMNIGKKDKAKETLQTALRYDPVNAVLYGDASYITLFMGDVETASQYALRSLELDETNEKALQTAALVSQLEGNGAQAEQYKGRYLANGGKAASLENDWSYLMEKGIRK